MFDDNVFLTIIKSKGIGPQTVAEKMGINVSTLYKKRKGLTEFTLGEMDKSLSLFTKREMQDIFFAK